MIHIKRSETADSRTCDYKNVSEETLMSSTEHHLVDVYSAMIFFAKELIDQAGTHDWDKVTEFKGFYEAFRSGFPVNGAQPNMWLGNHYIVNRHHLLNEEGVPEDVNLIDIMEFIADWVMAGMGRSGSVRPVELPPELLAKAFQNTIKLLEKQVQVIS